VTTTNIHHFK